METNDTFYNEEAEKNILGIMLVDPSKALSISNLINHDDFFLKPHREIYKTIVSLMKEGKVIDIVSVSEKLRFLNLLDEVGGREYISLLALDIIATSNYKHYCKIIIKYSKKRKLLWVCDNVKAKFEANEDVNDVAEFMRKQSETVLLSRSSTNLNSIFSGLDSVMEEINAVLDSDTKTFGLSTGFSILDATISGLCKSKLYILGARPAVGKSALAQQIAEYVSTNHNVVFHSLEMNKDQYTKRSIFRRTGLNNDLLSNNAVKLDDALNRVASVSEEISQLNLSIDDSSNCTLSLIEKNIVNTIESKGSCDLVVVDYLQLMTSDDKKVKDRFLIVSENSKGLKRLARKYNIPIILLCQLSRSLESRENKRPILSDLKDSGDIEQDADVVAFLYREEVHKPSPLVRGKAEVIIAKNREGSCRTIHYTFNGAKTEFKEVQPYG